MNKFKVIIVEDVPLELKGTEGIFKNDIPEAEIIGTADSEISYWKLIKQQKPDLVLLDLGLGGSTTVGVEICRSTKEQYPDVKVLIFTGEILNEKLWVDVLDAGCEGIILKSGELLTRGDVASCMSGKKLVFNQPILQKIVDRFKQSVGSQLDNEHQSAHGGSALLGHVPLGADLLDALARLQTDEGGNEKLAHHGGDNKADDGSQNNFHVNDSLSFAP